MAQEAPILNVEPTTVVLLNGHVVHLPYNIYVCIPKINDTLNLGQRSASLQCSAVNAETHKLIQGLRISVY